MPIYIYIYISQQWLSGIPRKVGQKWDGEALYSGLKSDSRAFSEIFCKSGLVKMDLWKGVVNGGYKRGHGIEGL